jgi:hypothetical protein
MEDARNFGNDLTAFGDLGAWGQLGNADWGEGMTTGAHAAASAMSFGLYDGGAYRCQPGFNTSKVLGGIAREALLQAGGEAMARCGSQLFASAMARRPGMALPGVAAAGKAAFVAGEEASTSFAHGTTLKAAEDISVNGLNQAKAYGASKRGLGAERGSFFTFEQAQGAKQLAYEMGLRHEDGGAVLICTMPSSTVKQLMAQGLMRVGDVPGIHLPETVFSPGAFDIINAVAKWRIIVP